MPNAPSAAPHLDPGVEPTRLALMLRAFGHRNYRLFFAGQGVSLCGTFLSQVAIVWVVYTLTKNPFQLGLVGFAGQIPQFVVAPFAGVWVDRLNRHRLLVITQALSMLQSFALAGMAFAHTLNMPAILALVLVQGLVNAFDMPGRQTFLVEMVTEPRDLPNAIALNSTMVHAARLIGPAAAGLLLYYVGSGWCFLLDGLSYLAVIASLLLMKIQPRAARSQSRSVLQELREGLVYVWKFPPIRAVLLLMAILSLTGMPAFTTLAPIFAAHFGGPEKGSQVLGLLMAASGLGALVGAIYLASRRSVIGLGKIICVAAALFGLGLVGFSFSRTLWVTLLAVPVVGWAMLLHFASANTLLQTLTDEDKRGRVMSFFTMAFIGVAPFGSLLAGWLARHFGGGGDNLRGASYTLRLEGIVCVLAAGVFALLLPGLRKHVRPVYVRKGILPAEVAAGIGSATEVVSSQERV